MRFEIPEERSPHRFEFGRSGVGPDLDDAVRRRIVIVQFVVPRQHRIAVYLPVDPLPGAKSDPAVEERIVVHPSAVSALGPVDHVFIGVETLVVPRVLVERRRDDLLSGVGEHPHQRTQGVEVRVAPQGETHYPRRGRRMLPEVEVVTPLRRAGQTPLLHAEFEGQFEAFHAAARHFDAGAVDACRRVVRHGDGQPHRTRSARIHVEAAERVEHVGRERNREIAVLAVAAARTERVGEHVTHEAGLRDSGGKTSAVRAEFPDAALHASDAVDAPQYQLGRNPFAAPCRQAAFGLRGAGHDGAGVTFVGRAPSGMQARSDARPVGERIGRRIVRLAEREHGAAPGAGARHKQHQHAKRRAPQDFVVRKGHGSYFLNRKPNFRSSPRRRSTTAGCSAAR